MLFQQFKLVSSQARWDLIAHLPKGSPNILGCFALVMENFNQSNSEGCSLTIPALFSAHQECRVPLVFFLISPSLFIWFSSDGSRFHYHATHHYLGVPCPCFIFLGLSYEWWTIDTQRKPNALFRQVYPSWELTLLLIQCSTDTQSFWLMTSPNRNINWYPLTKHPINRLIYWHSKQKPFIHKLLLNMIWITSRYVVEGTRQQEFSYLWYVLSPEVGE